MTKSMKKMISLILVLCLCFSLAAPAMAASPWSSRSSSSLLGGCFGQTSEPEEEEEETVTEPEPEETVTEEVTEDAELVLIEDESTVENGEMLRASTYALTRNAETTTADVGVMPLADETDTDIIKYYNATMYDYDTNVINDATHQVEVDAGLEDEWEGLYFSGGNPASESYYYKTGNQATIANGYKLVIPEFNSNGYITNLDTSKAYIFVSKRGEQAIYDNSSSSSNAFRRTAVSGSGETAFAYTINVTEWTLTTSGNGYRIRSNRSSNNNYYMVIGNGTGYSDRYSNPTTNIMSYPGDENCVVLNQGSYYLNHFGGTAGNTFAGYTSREDAGAAFYIYEVATNIVYDEIESTATLPFADWNHWDKSNSAGQNNYGQKTWTGLVESELDANKDIIFTVPEGGIFNDDATVKDIYTDVEIPFLYDAATSTYTFDASENGVYFHDNEGQASTADPDADDARMYFNKGNTQSNGGNYGDGSSTVWMPFNDATSIGGESACNYHFGMRTTIDFTMTTNGRLAADDNNSDPIKFSFSGDDDVWVFIDGKLIIDLGGIHNRLDADIDFAANTVTYSSSNGLAAATGSYNDEDFELTQTLFENLIPQDRESFAATDYHELTIFYLERGAGSSNGKIEFNLPVKDNVSVQKVVSGAAVVENGSVTTRPWSELSSAQQAVLNNQEFTFTLYNGTARVASATYIHLNANGQVIDTPHTDANGKFVLKNGETAKFITEFDSENGDEYYVVEDIKNGFIYTTYSYSHNVYGEAKASNTNNNAYSYYKASGQYYVTDMTVSGGTLESPTVNVVGGLEYEDSLSFVCRNYMNATLPNPSAIPNDERVVIDYGLPVVIDLFSNDLYLAEETEITFENKIIGTNDEGDDIYTADYGTFTYDETARTITYTLNEQLTGVEVISYTLTGSATATDITGNTTSQTASGTADVYIIPATSMYYEEDFGFVTYTGAWTGVGSAQNDNQEPGVVGTVGDSPYGSDAAYLNDNHDSNGTSMYVPTTETTSASFSYTFTGEGTTFFARTASDSAYMRVQVYAVNADGNRGSLISTYFRDTSYKNDSGLLVDLTNDGGAVPADAEVLYNIPVYTWNAEDYTIKDGDTEVGLNYGTYEVVVSIAKKTYSNRAGAEKWLIYGDQFWLDGIKVINPMNEADANASVAYSAYATDGESNMAVVTLRNKLIADGTVENGDGDLSWADNFVVFTDSNSAIGTVDEYVNNGPKEEVYLNAGQSITFSLNKWDANANKLYIGIKAPMGTGTVNINGRNININNAADCYYEISEYASISTVDGQTVATFTITAGANSLISVTNIKVTGGDTEFVVINQNDKIVDGSEGSDE